MWTPWLAVAGLDAAKAVCAGLNFIYFFHRLAYRPGEPASRKAAVLALALVSLGAIVESLFFLAAPVAPPAGSPLASLGLLLARAVPLAGTGLITLLVLRRISGR